LRNMAYTYVLEQVDLVQNNHPIRLFKRESARKGNSFYKGTAPVTEITLVRGETLVGKTSPVWGVALVTEITLVRGETPTREASPVLNNFI
jgi:hypothetical protein